MIPLQQIRPRARLVFFSVDTSIQKLSNLGNLSQSELYKKMKPDGGEEINDVTVLFYSYSCGLVKSNGVCVQDRITVVVLVSLVCQ